MEAVPTYALYGEGDETFFGQWLHCESISERSSRFDWEIRPHRHQDFFQILHICRGNGNAGLEGLSTRLDPPVAVTVPPRAVHGFRFSEDIEGSVITLVIDRVERMLQASPELCAVLARPCVAPLGGDEGETVLRSIAAVAAEFAGSAPGRDGLIEAHLAIVLMTLGRVVSTTVIKKNPSDDRVGRRASEFRILLDRQYRSHRSVGYYADRLAVSETHLNRICRSAFGRSALGVINARLVLEATRDLTFTLMSVKQIAHTLGFGDAAYFTRFFTRHVGLTPTRFREVSRRRSAADDPSQDPGACERPTTVAVSSSSLHSQTGAGSS